MAQNDEPQVQVQFFTQQKKYVVTGSTIVVPTRLRRFGLSEIINHLLNSDKPIPFDFLIDGEFIRTSLSEYLESKGLSTENLIRIEYIESLLPPQPLTTFIHDDWISSVRGSGSGLFLTGSYDHLVRVWNSSGECIHTLKGHQGIVKAVAWGGDEIIFSGGMDQNLFAWRVGEGGTGEVMWEGKGNGGVEGISVDSTQKWIATASNDSTVNIFTTHPPAADEVTNAELPSSKRRKISKTRDHPIKQVLTVLSGHVGPVSSVVFDPKDSNKLYSGGWDHSVRAWDIEGRVNFNTKNCEKVVYGLDYSPHSQLLASGHADRAIRLWDPRIEDVAVVKLTLISHTSWAPTVSWSATSAFNLISGSYDGTLKVWDIRSKAPMYTITPEEKGEGIKKVFSVHWDGERILSGGEKCQLRIHAAKM